MRPFQCIVCVWTFLAIGVSCAQLDILLHAPWNSTSFALNLLESIAVHPTKLFSALQHLVDVEEFDQDGELNDEIIHNVSQLIFDDDSWSLIQFDTLYKVHSPRIQSHYQFYTSSVAPKYHARLHKTCATDSFGNSVLDKDMEPEAWLLYNDKIYCSPDEIFALQLGKKQVSPSDLQPFDRIIGDSPDAPILTLYGDWNSSFFRRMLKNMVLAAEMGKLRFIWRYIPSTTSEPETLPGYGVDNTLKRTDYMVIDDRTSSDTKSDTRSPIKAVRSESIPDLGIKLGSYIKSLTPEIQFDTFKSILQEFPVKASEVNEFHSNQRNFRIGMKANEKLGLSKDSIGLYFNGALLNALELDVFLLVEKIKREKILVEELVALGMSILEAKTIITKFALLSAVKQASFYRGNSMMGGQNENRFKLHHHHFVPGLPTGQQSGGVIYFNDLEKDEVYADMTTDAHKAYVEEIKNLKPGQIPSFKENIHDVVLSVNIAERTQLETFFTLSKIILDKGLPQRIGLLPLPPTSDFEEDLIEIFYFLAQESSLQEVMGFLYKYLNAKTEEEVLSLIEKIEIPEGQVVSLPNSDTCSAFSILDPSIIVNGVIYELSSPTWKESLGKQLSQDVHLLQYHVANEGIKSSLSDVLYKNAKSTRNLRIVPKEMSGLKFMKIDKELLDLSILFASEEYTATKGELPSTFWLIGDLSHPITSEHFIQLIKLIRKTPKIQFRVIDTGLRHIAKSFTKQFDVGNLREIDIDNLIADYPALIESSERDPEVLRLLERNNLPLSHSYILMNSRYVRLTKNTLSENELNDLVEFEKKQRTDVLEEIVKSYPNIFRGQVSEYYDDDSNLDFSGWFDLLSSTIFTSFYNEATLFTQDVGRFDFSSMNTDNLISIINSASSKVDIFAIVDPIDEYSQKLVSILESVKDIPFVNIKILLQPNLLPNDEVNIKRLYQGNFPSSKLTFKRGQIDSLTTGYYSIPLNTLFTTTLDTPTRWITYLLQEPVDTDLDNLQLTRDENYKATYNLKSILVEGFAKDIQTGLAAEKLSLEAQSVYNELSLTDTISISSLGYIQLQTTPGLWRLRAQTENYDILSASKYQYDINTIVKQSIDVAVFSLGGYDLHLRVANPKEERQSQTKAKGSQASINIFSIASGHLYERFMSIMMTSVRKHSKETIKFWILDQFISPSFRNVLPKLAEKNNFEYEFISYKWPNWLRQQREKQREIWGYKILFLDTLFPQNLDKVIFVDADQVVRTDMMDLVNEDLGDAPYGYVPMCDTREGMEGFQFWKQGYWQKVLGDELKYHISALYVVDLQKFRSIKAGDRLRSSYQKLSSDKASLSNLDQDLPNNLQRIIPIHSLGQDWLWCETWCSEESKSRARTIDLCNNPLTKEPKLDRAKRSISEWVDYDDEVRKVYDSVEARKVADSNRESDHQQVVLDKKEESDDEDWEFDEL